MLNKKVLKDIQSLSLKKHRQERRLFVAEGPKIAGELIHLLPHHVVGIYATQDWAQKNEGIAAQIITTSELDRMSQLQTPNEVVVVLRQLPAKEPLIAKGWCLYLDGIQDPGNMGTIIRLADWFGIKDIVCGKGCADLYNPKVVQATMGGIARVGVWYDDESTWLQKQTIPMFAASLQGTSIYDFNKRDTGILVTGNESKGISDDVMQWVTQRITIPKVGEAESLNAAVATGIILSHVLR